jgi:hypothetical protein
MLDIFNSDLTLNVAAEVIIANAVKGIVRAISQTCVAWIRESTLIAPLPWYSR